MIAELGVFSLVLALIFACLLVIMPSLGLVKQNSAWILSAPKLVLGLVVFITLAYLALTCCFLSNDFSVTYVLLNSSLSLPWFYKLCAVWGGHEGSMLLWVMILSLWMLAVALTSQALDHEIRARVLVVLGLLSMGFILFLLVTSNPFARQFQVLNTTGRDLNPLLQDPGFLFHPPMLYMGYVGFSVAFAFAIAALWAGQLKTSYAKWTRPWTLAAWCCLTVGITLGSWWAYRELGWGGWWFWDPVENASFMPWLVGTALIHSLAVCEKRHQFIIWTVLLAIMAFSLSLIGTFLVRSGVLTSVHAFAVDPGRGLFILLFLVLVIGGSLLLFTLRANTLAGAQAPALMSKENALLVNNVFLTSAMFTVLLGTTYPLIIDGLGLGKLSVGAPYFNAVFVPLMLPVLAMMGLGVHLHWQQDSALALFKRLKEVGLTSFLIALACLGVMGLSSGLTVFLGVVLALWIVLSTCQLIGKHFNSYKGRQGFHHSFWGMVCAHLGVATTVIGIAISSGFGDSSDVRLSVGQSTMFAGYHIRLMSEAPLSGPNYHGTRAYVEVRKGQHAKLIFPEKRLYDVGQMAMTDSAIDVSPFRDVYVALGEPLGDDAWSMRLYYKPFVRWIWAGGFFMFAGGLLALSDRRYYRHHKTMLSPEGAR